MVVLFALANVTILVFVSAGSWPFQNSFVETRNRVFEALVGYPLLGPCQPSAMHLLNSCCCICSCLCSCFVFVVLVVFVIICVAMVVVACVVVVRLVYVIVVVVVIECAVFVAISYSSWLLAAGFWNESSFPVRRGGAGFNLSLPLRIVKG